VVSGVNHILRGSREIRSASRSVESMERLHFLEEVTLTLRSGGRLDVTQASGPCPGGFLMLLPGG
jgi:hypothetical protein